MHSCTENTAQRFCNHRRAKPRPSVWRAVTNPAWASSDLSFSHYKSPTAIAAMWWSPRWFIGSVLAALSPDHELFSAGTPFAGRVVQCLNQGSVFTAKSGRADTMVHERAEKEQTKRVCSQGNSDCIDCFHHNTAWHTSACFSRCLDEERGTRLQRSCRAHCDMGRVF
jgi:hypothetical protein